tara:strand:+ start:430 stop:741 length:312 start_codon:yes stop_codon:yes gene_type:complete
MADEKKKKVKMKVKTTEKSPIDVDTALNDMAKLFLNKPVTGEMDLLIKKKAGEIVINEYTISDSLGDEYRLLGDKIRESALNSLGALKSGRIRVIYETEFFTE